MQVHLGSVLAFRTVPASGVLPEQPNWTIGLYSLLEAAWLAGLGSILGAESWAVYPVMGSKIAFTMGKTDA